MSTTRESAAKSAPLLDTWRARFAHFQLLRDAMLKARSARLSRWLFALFTFVSALELLGTGAGKGALADGLASLVWPSFACVPAFFRMSTEQERALARLRTLHALPTNAATPLLARALLVFLPLSLSGAALWSCALVHADGASAFLWLGFGLCSCLVVQGVFALALSASASLGESLAPEAAQRTTWLLLLLPAALFAVVPELPSLWHAYQHWVSWSASLAVVP